MACGDDSSNDASDETDVSADAQVSSNDANSSGASEPAAQAIQVEDAWTYAIVDPSDEHVGAMFMSISGGTDDDLLLGAAVSSEIAAHVEMKTAVPADNSTLDSPLEADDTGNAEEGGARVLEPVSSFTIHSGGTINFEPGGHQLVLTDLQRAIDSGETFELTLIFEESGPVPVMVSVR